jgi:acetolactate synthase-1/2/3 large subunit
VNELTGAQALLQTLLDGGVDVCFTNPGTSEMHLVAGMESVPQMRGVLCLFEGVATGAADGYARMAGRPGSTLLHLGPGLGNGLANLHNARRAATPIVNLVGDHATYHKQYDAPLESDIDALAGTVSRWVHRSSSQASIGADAGAAIAAARAGGVATLILPADVCWSPGGVVGTVAPAPAPAIDEAAVEQVARTLRENSDCLLLLGGPVLRPAGLAAASRIAAATGARLLAENAPARHTRGAGLPAVDRLFYLAEMAVAQLQDVKHLILVGARSPVSFFAYPGKPSDLVAPGTEVLHLGGTEQALEALADLVAGDAIPTPAPAHRPDRPTGPITAEKAAAVVGALLPENAIVSDEAITSGLWLAAATAGSPAHDWLNLTGGSIGQGMPVATGAAIACPTRPVINLQAEGSAMYTVQSLWTQAREDLDVTTVIFNNASYAILHMELQRTGAVDADAKRSRALLDLPGLDVAAMANGFGVPAKRVDDSEAFAAAFAEAVAEPGPHLIEVVLPPR